MKSKILLSRSEFVGLATIVIHQYKNGSTEREIEDYLDTLFLRIKPKKKKSIARFIMDHDQELFLLFFISTFALMVKIAIEAYFLR